MNNNNIANIKNIIKTKKSYTYPFNPVSIMSLNIKSFEVCPKHNGYDFSDINN